MNGRRLYTAFFLSGAAGLILQVAWMKSLVLVFGATVYAVTTVLAAFMGGLGLGSWLLSKKLENYPRPARAYAILEAATAAAALLTFALIPLFSRLYTSFSGGGGLLLRFVLSVILLGIPTFLMGGTLPLLVRAFRAGATDTGRPVARLYALNTLGAVTGAFLSGFVFVPMLGLWQTGVIAAVCNVAAAVLAWDAIPDVTPQDTTDTSAPAAGVLGLVSFLSGATAMMLEVAWTRRLAAPLGGSVYAFTVILVTFLVGIAVGSRAFTRVSMKTAVNREGLGVVQLGLVMAGVLAVAMWAGLPSLVFFLMEGLGGSFVGVVMLQFVAAFLILLPAALLYGLGFPWLAQLYAPAEHEAGTLIGRLYALNTAGAICGAVLAGFVIVPMAGAYMALAAALIGSAICAMLLLPKERMATAGAVIVLLIVVSLAGRLFTLTPIDQEAVIASFFHNDLYRSGLTLQEIADAQDYLFMEDGLNATVGVSQSESYLALRLNGKVDASSGDMKTQLALAAVPLSLHPAPKHVLVIGFGSGATSRVAALWPGVERVDTVEIEPAVLRAAEFLKEMNGGVQHWPNSRVIVDDARHYLAVTPEHYDVIISEPSNPWMAGIGNLFTQEFYAQAQAHLNAGGVFTQWVQGYQLLPVDVSLVVRTLLTAFPHTTMWRGDAADFLLVGFRDAQPLRLEDRAWPKELAKIFHTDLKVERPLALWAYFLLGEDDLKGFAGSGEVNTDNHPRLEYRAPLRLLRPSDNTLPRAVIAARRTGPPVTLTAEDQLVIAKTLLRVGEVEWSRMVARPLFERLKDKPEVWLYAGDLNNILRNFDLATSCYKSALERGGGAAAKSGLAIVAAETGNPQAEAMLRDALASADSPPSAELDFALARYLAYNKKWTEALEPQKQGLAVSEGYLALEWAQYGDLCLRAGKGAEAQTAFDKALSLDKYNYGAHRIMAEFFLAAGMYKESAQQYRFLAKYHPLRDPGLYQQAAEALRRAGDASQANRMLAKGRRLFPPTHPTNAPQ